MITVPFVFVDENAVAGDTAARAALAPARHSDGAAGLDLAAAVDDAVVIPPMGRALIPTGVALAIPLGYEGQVRPRSGLALRHGLTCLNSPGTIDADYRGEVKVLLINLGEAPVTIERYMRVAQLVLAPVVPATLTVVATLDDTPRGTGGFGSTGTAGGEPGGNSR
jgi:dUTP pyrophosphatase